MSQSAFDEIAELTDIYYRQIANDHHKSRDCYFTVDCTWTSWDDPVVPKFKAIHRGYLNDLDGPERATFDEAVEDLREFLIECIADWKPEDWSWGEDESEVNRTVDTSSAHIS